MQDEAAAPGQNGTSSEFAPTAQNKNPPKPRVLIMSLEKEPYTDEMYSQLYRALRKNAIVTEVCHSRTANRALSATPRPDAVLVSDAAITTHEHPVLLQKLIAYARSGGRVVLGMQLSNHFRLDRVGPFFRKWGLGWDQGSYHRTTFGLNPSGLPAPLDASALFPSVSMKALHIKNAPRECAVYLPTSASRLESLVYASVPITGDRAADSPAVFTRVGSGYLGYVGDVNAEQGSLRLTVEMCGVKIQPGDLGSTYVTTGVCMHPDGRTEAEKQLVEEVPLPVRAGSSSSTSTTATPAVASGSGSGSSGTPSPAPAGFPTSASSSDPKARTPARPREAEVIARAAQRAKVREEKTKRGDALKEEGNALFKEGKWAEAAEKYRAAAFAAGPLPVYMSNLAAALLKLKLWTLADSAASRALLSEPGHVKALFRRAQARKELCRFKVAEADLQRILELDPSNDAARNELETVRTLKRTKPSADLPEDDDLLEENTTDHKYEEESDSEDFKHEGNGTPCRFYNHGGCTHGQRCRFSHAPDRKSVRDDLGRNVCVYWLLDECRFGAGKCTYAHDRTYLPARGWWTDEGRNERLRTAARETFALIPQRYFPKAMLAEVAKPGPWREDWWATAAYTGGTTAGKHNNDNNGKKGKGKGKGKSKGKKTQRGHGGYNAFGFEYDDYDMYRDHMDDFYEELMMQGIKPWEADEMSMRELAAIHDVLYDAPY